MADMKQYYSDMFRITEEDARKRYIQTFKRAPNENMIRTTLTEMIGETILKKGKIFDAEFSDNIGYKKVVKKKLQKAGADYEIYFEDKDPIYIDLKTCIGPDFSMKDLDYNDPRDYTAKSKSAPIEIYQNGIFTNTKGKFTDYFLYIIADNDGMFYSLIDYDKIYEISKENKGEYIVQDNKAILVNKGKYRHYTSNNGSGIYIKYPVTPTRIVLS